MGMYHIMHVPAFGIAYVCFIIVLLHCNEIFGMLNLCGIAGIPIYRYRCIKYASQGQLLKN